jgi:uncharacterized protein (DUF885 family)
MPLRFARVLAGLLLAVTFMVVRADPARSPAVAADATYEAVVTAVLQDYYRRNPTAATDLGLHEFDGRLEDYSSAAIAAGTEAMKRLRDRLRSVPPDGLTPTQRLDREFLLGTLDGQILRNESVRAWERDPDLYSSGITNAAYSLIKREYAPAEERLRSLIQREKQMPATLAAARRNLVNPPRIYTEIALEQLDGNLEFFRTAVVEAFAGVRDAALQADFGRSNDAVVAALADYRQWLQDDLLPRSNGSFALGPDLFRQLLLADEMIDVPLDRLLALAEADLRRNQAAFEATARRIDPARNPSEVLESLQRDHPAPAHLLDSTQAELDALARFMTDRRIVTIPEAAPARVKETPPFMRATTSAALDTPGPFETARLAGYYLMTLPDPAWSDAETEDFMRQWFYPLITNTSVHEVWPGHYLQFLYSSQYPSDVRKVFYSNSNAEGWAHYCEQMVIDEGFHADDPRYRLAQLQDALLRNARFVVGIRMHTQGMSFEQAQAYFEQEGYQPAPVALSEARRGTSDATYGYYTLGKLAILKLRDDYRAKLGASYSLQQFHDALMRLGPLPLPLVREAMLGERGSLF